MKQQDQTPGRFYPVHRIAILIRNLLLKQITESELNELNNWLAQHESNRQLFDELINSKYISQTIYASLN
jgi:hypothetical protein